MWCIKLLQTSKMTKKVVHSTIVPDEQYFNLMNKAIKDGKKFKEHVISKTGQKTRVRYSKGELWENKKKIEPYSIMLRDDTEIISELARKVHKAYQLAEEKLITEEFKNELVEELFERVIQSNKTGNHYRNKTMKVNAPSGSAL